jgi:hypothetical protein
MGHALLVKWGHAAPAPKEAGARLTGFYCNNRVQNSQACRTCAELPLGIQLADGNDTGMLDAHQLVWYK